MGSMHYLAIGVGLFFVVAGLVKVAPIQPAHNQMVSAFGRYASVFPLKMVGIQPAADMYRALTGAAEILMGSLLAFGRYDWRSLSCLGLFVITVGAVQTHLALGDAVAEMFPALIAGGLLLILLFHPNGFWGSRGGKLHLA
ncbi:hypothetical protein BSL78_17422 [Apostichopus japonicus]|uniref:Transmembrane protein n=1 Tax=Stichopus japonicus TaxID=307972 RepID=A0A2G8KCJ2_STIJA|nr:hypothetical protein BSL78_17422 [Apostichopus japonicus]